MNRRLATILLTLLVTAGAAPGGTQAAGPNMSMTVDVDFAAGTAPWSATGAIADSGTAIALYHEFGSLSGPSPQWTEREEILFVGRSGSFTIRQQALFVDDGPLLSFGTSHWLVVAGSGAYAGLRGRGTATIVAHWDTETLDIAIVGSLAFDDRMR